MNITGVARFAPVSVSVAVLLAMSADQAAADTVGRRYALIIGVSQALRLEVPKLNFVDNDIEKLGEMLRRDGYDVKTVPNERADRRRILGELYTLARQLTELDTFVLYYAGHGVRNLEVNRKTYWLTYEAELAMLDVEGIRLEHLLAYVDDIKAGKKLILLDHCFSGDVEGIRLVTTPRSDTTGAPVAPGDGAVAMPRLTRSATVVELTSELTVPGTQGTAIIAAARDLAYELPDLKHGVFTKALLDACALATAAGADYKRSLPELVKFVKPRVDELLKTAGAPSQRVVDKAAGSIESLDWTFCTVPVAQAEVAPRAAEYAATIQAWETKGLLSARRRIVCADVLDKWKAAGGNQAAFSLTDSRLITALRLFADPNEPMPEQARADSLNDVLQREGFQ